MIGNNNHMTSYRYRYGFIFACIICLFMFKNQMVAQGNNGNISLTDVHVPGIITLGTYSQLIELQGYPNSHFASSINPISPKCLKEGDSIIPKHIVQCEYLVYDACEYVRVGDSVQLVFVDLRKTNVPISINGMAVTRKTTQREFLSEITKKVWWSEEQSQYKVGEIESHYYTHSKVKNFGVDYKEDPYSSVIFTFYNRTFDKRIWWIEFPIMRIGGIVH